MDVCLLELSRDAEPSDLPDLAEPGDGQRTLADTWTPLWSSSEDAERATHDLCVALPLITTEEALLN
ncbi:MAG TPA: hypothetical protein VFX49_15780 [Chloroflexota bacterium]|nr:hypothetical protein [Chloroflexota bacterium]